MRILRSQSGFSLLELLISIVIISSVLAGILNVYNTALRLNTLTSAKASAKFHAEQEMERLLSLDYNAPEIDAFNNFEGVVNFFEDEDYLLKTNVVFIDPTTGEIKEPYPVSPEDDTRLKRVIVSAIRKDGIGGQVDLVTYISP